MTDYIATMCSRVTSLEQLCLAEFRGDLVGPKVYENGHKNVPGIWIDLEWKVKYSTILVFKAIFIHPNSVESFYKTILVTKYQF